MARITFFVQECPTCGRNLQVRVEYLGKQVEYLGKQVVCQHCHGRFEACDPAGASDPSFDTGIGLMRRADELLESADEWKGRPR